MVLLTVIMPCIAGKREGLDRAKRRLTKSGAIVSHGYPC
jgi:hypothetical protein